MGYGLSQNELKAIRAHPVRKGLETFRTTFKSVYLNVNLAAGSRPTCTWCWLRILYLLGEPIGLILFLPLLPITQYIANADSINSLHFYTSYAYSTNSLIYHDN